MISKTVNSWDQAVTAAKNANYKMVSVFISGADSENLPTGNNTHWGIIYCNPGGTYGGVTLQTFNGNLYTRYLTSGNWSTWILQPTRTEVDTLNSKIQWKTLPALTNTSTNKIWDLLNLSNIGGVYVVIFCYSSYVWDNMATAYFFVNGTNQKCYAVTPFHVSNGDLAIILDTDGTVHTNGGTNPNSYQGKAALIELAK